MRLLCLDCGEEITLSEDHEIYGCPNCGATSIPADLDDAVTVTITNHELRILSIWASNWAYEHTTTDLDLAKPISVILARLGTQTLAALTLSQEIADLRATFPNSKVTVYGQDGEEVDI